MIKILVNGPKGNMGQEIIRVAYNKPELEIVGGVGPVGRDYIGKDLGVLVGLGDIIGAIVYDNINLAIQKCDIVIDCTRPEVTLNTMEACIKYGKALVTGTTGFSDEESKLLKDAGKNIPILVASNTSKIAHIFFDLIKILTKRAGNKADIDIIEMHENKKLDAPSGTAMEIASLIADELHLKLDQVAEYGRKGKGIRPAQSICFHSIRSGNYPTSHKVIFGHQNEKIELAFDGYNMIPFAEGIVDAVKFLYNKKPGLYKIENVFDS
jgi:4-hydroxy-tetrahydrodipicolinate reductase